MGKVIPKILLGLAALLLCVYIVFQIYSANSSKVGVETALSMEMEDTITVEGLALREETENSEYFSEDRTFIHNDRIHRIVFRLQAIMSVFLIISLYCCGIIHQRNNDLSV